MKEHILIFIASLLVGTGGYVGYSYVAAMNVPAPDQEEVKSAEIKKVDYDIEKAPSETLRGTISNMYGEINWQSRVATEPAKLEGKRPIQQGEQLSTGEDGTLLLEFNNDTTLEFDNDSVVDIIQTLPTSFVFMQEKGTVTYNQLPSSSTPLAVRVRHLLVRLLDGGITVTLEDDDPYIIVGGTQGTFEVAYNDNTLTSHRFTVNDGDTLIFDDETRTSDIQ